jgi:hypothetical protein
MRSVNHEMHYRSSFTLLVGIDAKAGQVSTQSRLSSEGRALVVSLAEPSDRPNRRAFLKSALQAAEKILSFVGHAFRHDIKSAFSSGVLTPEGLKAHFSATCLAAEAVFGCRFAGTSSAIKRYALTARSPDNRAVIVISAFSRREMGQPAFAFAAAFSNAARSTPGIFAVTSR